MAGGGNLQAAATANINKCGKCEQSAIGHRRSAKMRGERIRVVRPMTEHLTCGLASPGRTCVLLGSSLFLRVSAASALHGPRASAIIIASITNGHRRSDGICRPGRWRWWRARDGGGTGLHPLLLQHRLEDQEAGPAEESPCPLQPPWQGASM